MKHIYLRLTDHWWINVTLSLVDAEPLWTTSYVAGLFNPK